MPISEERLYSEVNAYTSVSATITVKQALQAWHNEPSRWGKAREWWWLMIEHSDGHFTAIPLEQLRDLLIQKMVQSTTRLAELPAARENPVDFSQLPGVITARKVERNALSTASALDLAENSPGNLLAVTQDGKLVGIINKRMRNFAMANLSLFSLLEEMETQDGSTATATPAATPTPEPPQA